MVVEKFPVVILPSGRVPGRVLLVLPILEAAAAAEQRWDREKKSCFEGFGGSSGGRGAPPARPGVGPRGLAAWAAPGSPLAPLLARGSFWSADFLYIFPGIFLAI